MTPLIDSPREHLQVLSSARRPRVAFYSQLVTFIHAPTALAFDQLVSTLDTLAVVLTIQHVTEPLIHVQSARLALAAVLSRFERTGALAVTSLDELTFRAAIPHIETALGRCRIDAFNLAHAIVKANAQALGASTVN